MPGISIRARPTGPLFDGRADRALADYSDALAALVASEGVSIVRSNTAVFRNPTGHYRSRVSRTRRGGDRVIHDGRIVYGPWLEGVSRRNQTTRFPGYHFWRKSTRQLDARVPQFAAELWPIYKSRIG